MGITGGWQLIHVATILRAARGRGRASPALGWLCAALACSAPATEDPAALAEQIARGDDAFHDHALGGLGGNGRACSDCHVDASGFQLRPSDVEARYLAMRSSGIDDALFRPTDADDFPTRGELAGDYSNLRQNGLVRIRLGLPPTIKLVDPASCTTAGIAAPCETASEYAVSTASFTDVWRAVPTVLNVRHSGPDRVLSVWPRGPNAQGGYQLDARVDTLANQALAALRDHAEVASDPSPDLLDDIAAFESQLVAGGEPPLDALQTAGKAVFDRACAQCHGGPAMSTPAGTPIVIRFHDDRNACPRSVDTEVPARWSFEPCPRRLARNEQTYEITFADGFSMRRTTTDPGRALLSGFVFSGPPNADGSCAHAPCGSPHLDDWQKLEIAPLRGLRDTAPYFHNNSAATLEEVVIHYEVFFLRESAVTPASEAPPLLSTDGVRRDRPNVPSERAALVAYLGTL